jgi:hypothetical protein
VRARVRRSAPGSAVAPQLAPPATFSAGRLPKGLVRAAPPMSARTRADDGPVTAPGPDGSGAHASARAAPQPGACPLPQNVSTQSLGVAAGIGLARALGPLPRCLVIYAIEARHASDGEGLSPEVDRAVDEVVALVMQASHV